MSNQAQHEYRLRELTDMVAQRVPTPQTPAEQSAEFARLQRRLESGRSRWLVTRILPALAVCAVIGIFARNSFRSEAVTFAVQNGTVAGSGFVATSATPALISFSDGSTVELATGSHGRVAATNSHGARIALESGRLRVHVVPRPDNDWKFDAGPCLVSVTGTHFDLSWSPGNQVLDIWLEKGSVIVQGPATSTGVTVRTGQHLTMDIRTNAVRITPIETEVKQITIAPIEPDPSERPPAEPEPAPAKGWTRQGLPWATRVLNGDFKGVVSNARKSGLKAALQDARIDDLMALADAARFDQNPELARDALNTVRQRFASSQGARNAAFLLGRLAEESSRDLVAAVAWYDVYLSSEQGGGYEAEALGRKMAATFKLRGKKAARPIALDYLKRFPYGSYADAARKLSESP